MADAPDTIRDAETLASAADSAPSAPSVPDAPLPARVARRSRRPAWLIHLARGLGLGVAFFELVYARVVLSSSSEYARGRSYLAAGDVASARMAYRRAASWAAPGNPYARRALDALAGLARDAEGEGRDDDALAAWRGIRGALLGARTFGAGPDPARLAVADRRIAALMARAQARDPQVRSSGDEVRARDAFLAELEAPVVPEPLWTVATLLGLLVFFGGALALSREGFDLRGRFRGAITWRYLAITLTGLLMLVLGLTNA